MFCNYQYTSKAVGHDFALNVMHACKQFDVVIQILFCIHLHNIAQEKLHIADPELRNYTVYILTGAESISSGNASVPQAKRRIFRNRDKR